MELFVQEKHLGEENFYSPRNFARVGKTTKGQWRFLSKSKKSLEICKTDHIDKKKRVLKQEHSRCYCPSSANNASTSTSALSRASCMDEVPAK